MNQTTFLTPAGLDRLKAELEELKTGKRPLVIQRIKEAVSHGDLKENSEYDDAKNEQGFIEGRIAELEALLKNSQVVSGGSDNGAATLGSVVTVKHSGSTSSFTIVSPAEADPTGGLISNESPLGEALLGKKTGDKAAVETPKGRTTYTLTKIK